MFIEKRAAIRVPFKCTVYYSDGAFHASGETENVTVSGGRLRGTHPVMVGMELIVLLIPPHQRALLVKKAMVCWVSDASFGVVLHEDDCGAVTEIGDEEIPPQQGIVSFLTH